MSDGEVKRFMAIVENPIFAYDDVRRLCVLESDHERVVDELKAEINGLKERLDVFRNREYEARNIEELKAEVLQYHRMAASGVWIPSDEYREKIETIAKQAKVIEIAKRVLYNAGLRPPDGGMPTVETICEDLNDAIKEIAAIERAEGEKEHE